MAAVARLRRRSMPLVLLVAGTVVSCGITTLPFLQPPIAGVASTIGRTFEFDGPDPTMIDELLFEGYELYYKFYPVGGEGPTHLTSLAGLISGEFARFHQIDDESGAVGKPLLKVDLPDRTAPQSATITFDFGKTPPEPWVTTDWGASATVELRRATLDALDLFELLSDTGSFDALDFDVKELFDPGPLPETDDIALLLYALSFGRDFATEIHSAAVYLGEIIVTFP